MYRQQINSARSSQFATNQFFGVLELCTKYSLMWCPILINGKPRNKILNSFSYFLIIICIIIYCYYRYLDLSSSSKDAY